MKHKLETKTKNLMERKSKLRFRQKSILEILEIHFSMQENKGKNKMAKKEEILN